MKNTAPISFPKAIDKHSFLKAFVCILSITGYFAHHESQAQCNETAFPNQWTVHELETSELPYRSVYIYADFDIDGDGRKDIVTGQWWYRNPGSASGNWARRTIGGSFRNMAYIHDFDGDGDLDLLGTTGDYQGADLVWAQNDGSGNFTVRNNIPPGDTDFEEPFLAGIAGDTFTNGGPFQMAINWNGAEATNSPVQMLTVPADPVNTQWTLVDISSSSLGEDLQKGDIDGDGDLDLFQSKNWLRNNGDGTWATVNTGIDYVTTPDRAQLSDLDGDGDLDAVVGQLGLGGNSDRMEFAWFEAPSNPSDNWTKRILANDISGSLSVFTEDIDQDGDDDIIVGEWKGRNRLIAFENDLCNSGTWIRQFIDAGGTGFDHHDGARVVDIDNDGDFDIVSIGWDNIVPRIFENTSSITTNVPPTANVGADQEITLPMNAITLTGSGSDPDGGEVSFLWTQRSGPNTATLSGEDGAELAASGLIAGAYVFRLTVTDDEGETDFDELTANVNAEEVADEIPLVDAGADQSVNLPENTVTLTGSGSDPDGGEVSFLWTQRSGPNTATLSGEDGAELAASGLVAGAYVFRLTVTDDEGETDFDELTANVNAEEVADEIPLVDAGADQSVNLPENTVTLTGSGSDPDGGEVSFLWTQRSGPNTATLSGEDGAELSASGLVAGAYVFRLTVTDDEDETDFKEVTVNVIAEDLVDEIPIVDAGGDQSVNLPENTVTLTGSGSDLDGGEVSFLWTQRSGPNTATLSGEDGAELSASGLVAGAYIFRLTVTDDEGETAFDELTVTVNSEDTIDEAPEANATATPLTGTGPLEVTFNASEDTTISNYLWDFGDGTTSTEINPEYTFKTPGTYEVTLTVTDDQGLTDTAVINIVVSTPETQEPSMRLETNPAKEGTARLLLMNQPEDYQIVSLFLHDASGRLINIFNVQEIAVTSDAYDIPVATLRDGVYHISIVSSQGTEESISLVVKN